MKTRTTLLATAALLVLPAIGFADMFQGPYVSYGSGSLVVGPTEKHETYSYEKDVRWEDDAGATVDYHSIKVGRPVTVYYKPSGSTRTVERVVVHKE